MDDEARAGYWVGRYQYNARVREGCKRKPTGPSGPDDQDYIWDIDAQNVLQLYLDLRPPTGSHLRMLGQIVDGVLQCWRADGKDRAQHEHPHLKCYTIARYPIVHAARFGFRAIQLNGGEPISVERLLAMPEVPKKYRNTFERQIQIKETA